MIHTTYISWMISSILRCLYFFLEHSYLVNYFPKLFFDVNKYTSSHRIHYHITIYSTRSYKNQDGKKYLSRCGTSIYSQITLCISNRRKIIFNFGLFAWWRPIHQVIKRGMLFCNRYICTNIIWLVFIFCLFLFLLSHNELKRGKKCNLRF